GTMSTASAHVTRTFIFIDSPTSRTARPARLSSNRAATNSPPSFDPQQRELGRGSVEVRPGVGEVGEVHGAATGPDLRVVVAERIGVGDAIAFRHHVAAAVCL